MRDHLIYISVLITLFCYSPAWADTFVVNSALPTGAGSLRDAIEKANANGTAVTDYITFDLPTRRGPATILLAPNNPLPALTSNIIIDGSTQTGDAYGITDAKVAVAIQGFFTDNSRYYFIFQATNATNIQIYGLFLWAQVGDRTTGQPPQHLYGINLRQCSEVIIGAPGKGNLISGWARAVYAEYFRGAPCHHITVQSNIMGVKEDGISTTLIAGTRPGDPGTPATNDYCLYFDRATDLFIGGEAPEQGNRFSALNDVYCKGHPDPALNDSILIINNKLGIDVNDDMVAINSVTGIHIEAYNKINSVNRADAGIIIRKNYIAGRSRNIAISLADVQSYFAIEQNLIGGEKRNLPIRNTTMGIGINIISCAMGIIGDTRPGNENRIRYCNQFAVHLYGNSNITFRYNSTYCNAKRAVAIENWAAANGARPQPFITVNGLNQATGTIRGTTLPNSTVDLYTDDDCPNCEGKTHLGIIAIADATGQWTYTDPSLTGKSIVATATDPQGATSEYSAPLLEDDNLLITPVSCNALGAICGLKIISGADWEWRDITGIVVGRDTCLTNVPAGTYTLWLPVGSGSCQEEFTFIVPANTLDIDSSAGIIKTTARCNKNNGSICGLKAVGAVSWSWEDALGNTISTDMCLTNVPAGTYRFKVSDGSCDKFTNFYTITNVSPDIDITNLRTQITTCNKANGSITGLTLSGMNFSTPQWIDENRNIVATTTDLLNIAAGRYKFIVLDNTAGCGDSTNWITVAATPAPALVVSAVQVTHATCGQANGNIFNITTVNTTGLVEALWVDESGAVVGNDLSLLSIKAGKYRLKIKDRSTCDTVVSAPFVVLDNGTVTLDSSTLTVTNAGCTRNNGSITGMKIAGATFWQWHNLTTSQVVGNNPEVSQLPAGSYQLWATNSIFNCQVKSHIYNIGIAPPLPVAVTRAVVKDAACNQPNGSITVNDLSNDQSLFSFRWLLDSLTQTGTGLSISNLNPATYFLIATDTNGCEQSIYKKAIVMQALPAMDETGAVIRPDNCGFGTGSIAGITATSAVGALQYQWYNNTNIPVGQQATVTGLQAGTYHLVIKDINGCTLKSSEFSIPQVIMPLPAPQCDNITIPRNTDGTLKVRNPRAGATYALYHAGTNALIEQNQTGSFTLKKVPEDTRYYIIYQAGPCTSEPGQVSIKVIDMTKLDIPNTFTPNNDGINDEFRIGVTGYFKLNALKIFNRWGQLVFESKDLKLVWNGNKNGQLLPVATYYWVIEGIDLNGKLLRQSGSVTLIR
ncbi:gliding motility-associated C-terminal domain-containing protein [Paraflavitalea soli]|uniref:Gliding motility-associated C-terminal domain-containing protein n=1 Tax=Paraflavitalea soli TaxID=2315862 RepID=A0A3B7N4U7_9BACT|nr:gliding motility-associated C-terminal domain-containing protein [Paraflavitalea soli]AXY77131.1 gliding motility-associated C-terminal domain-containing protein [Paraflavitalea soli]